MGGWVREGEGEERLRERFEISTKKIGSGEKEERKGKVLNRVIRCGDQGWEYEPDQRHAELIIEEIGTNDANPVLTPASALAPTRRVSRRVPLPLIVARILKYTHTQH